VISCPQRWDGWRESSKVEAMRDAGAGKADMEKVIMGMTL